MNAKEPIGHCGEERRGLYQDLDKLTDEQSSFVPRDGPWSLGIVACHFAQAEEGWSRYYAVACDLDKSPRYPAADYTTVEAVKGLLADAHTRSICNRQGGPTVVDLGRSSFEIQESRFNA